MILKGLAVTWFRQEDFPRWVEIDPNFQPDYNHWLRRMEDQLAALDRRGVPYEKVLVDPEVFLAWCKRRGWEPNSSARSMYASLTIAGDIDGHVNLKGQDDVSH